MNEAQTGYIGYEQNMIPQFPKPSKVLVIGSGPIIIGQAAGFDYVSCSPFRVPIARLACAQATVLQRRLLEEAEA